MLLRCESLEPPMSQMGQSRRFAMSASLPLIPLKALVKPTSGDVGKVPGRSIATSFPATPSQVLHSFLTVPPASLGLSQIG